jgi:uncharacterized FlaG/YvyC family protein
MMEINPLSLVNPLTPIDSAAGLDGNTEQTRAAVTAVRALNKSELFGQDRELLFTRDSDTRKPVIRIVSRTTGEVLDQIPPERVLKIAAELAKQGKDGSAA